MPMITHDFVTQEHPLCSVEGGHLLTFKSMSGSWYAQVSAPGLSATAEGASRGEAAVALADVLKQLGCEVARQAFEHYGAVRIGEGRPR